MGGAISSAARGSITREQLLRSTQNSRMFTNKLFNVMLDKLTPADFLALGNPNKCSTFVFMMADGIQNLFRDLRIRPRRDRDTGVVYFQKVDTLRAQTAETRELCMTIAYFYIRIFQIFGALAMSILDDPGAGGVLGAVQYGVQQRPTAGPGGIFGFGQPKRIPGSYGAILSGGAAAPPGYFDGVGKPFAPIKSILDYAGVFTSNSNANTYEQFWFKHAPYIKLIPGLSYNRIPQNLKITINMNRESNNEETYTVVYGNMILDYIDSNRYRVTLRNFRTDDTRITDEAQKTLYTYTDVFNISIEKDGSVKVAKQNITIAQKILSVGKKIITISNGLIANPYASIATILDKKDSQKYKVVYDQARVVGPGPGVTVGIPRELQNQYIIEILKAMSGQAAPGQKTVAFCIARALQLLDAKTLSTPRPQQGQSGVCMAKFDTLPTSVPQTGQSITTVPGLHAVDQLFYVNPSADRVRVSDQVEYSDFLQQISGLFGKPTTAKLSRMDEILAKDPNCPTAAAKQYLQLQDPKGIQRVMGVVNQMFARQLAHTQRVIKFFRERLFRIARGREGELVDIHPRLLQGGIGELAVVSKEARELLIQYYKDCETLYQQGAVEVLRSGRV